MELADKKAIGERLAKLRGNRTQKELAEKWGCSPMAVSQYESGKRVPNDDMKILIARFYGKSVQSIFFAK